MCVKRRVRANKTMRGRLQSDTTNIRTQQIHCYCVVVIIIKKISVGHNRRENRKLTTTKKIKSRYSVVVKENVKKELL